MQEITYKKLHGTETILNAMPAIIEAFVTFYGEEERECIESKFKNMLVITYCHPDKMESILRDDKRHKSTELMQEFFSEVTLPGQENMDFEQFKKIFFGDNDFDFSRFHPISQYINYKTGNINFRTEPETFKFLSSLYPDINSNNINDFISQISTNELDEYVRVYEEKLKKYNDYKESMKEYNDYIEKCNKLKEELKKKYQKKLVSSLKDLFTENELQEIEKSFNDRWYFGINSINGKTKNFFGYSLNSTLLISAFSKENDELLINGSDWQKESVLRDRVTYYKNLGLDLGNDYELYKNNPKAIELTPSKELVERVISTTKGMHTKMMNEYYQSLPEYQENMQRIENVGVLDKVHGYDANAYENNTTFVNPNIRQVNNEYQTFCLMCVSMYALDGYEDAFLLHELNHVYETHLRRVEGDKYYISCGWDNAEGRIQNESVDMVSLDKREEKRDYELISEIINELLSQGIHKILFDAGICIFNDKETTKMKGGTSYENTMFLIREFYDTYKKEIIASRKKRDMTILFEKVGKENFEELNSLFHIFYENFSGFKFYNVIGALNKGIENEDTKILKGLIEKRNQILDAMAEHSNKRAASI